MNILVVDDEPKLRRGIAKHLSNMDLKFDVIETAENGEIALIKAREIKPEIIFLDICMPKLNGLEFIEALSLECEQPEIVIISGFDDFSYIQQALRYKVTEYLLKPINLPDFDNLVHRIYNEIILKKKNDAYTKYAINTIKENKDHLYDVFFHDLLRGLLSQEEIEKQASMINIIFPKNPHMILVKIGRDSKERASQWNVDTLRFAIRNILSKTCCDLLYVSIFFNRNNDGVIICEQDASLLDICNKIKKNIHTALKFQTKILTKEFKENNLQETYKNIMDDEIKSGLLFSGVKQAKEYIDINFSNHNISLESVATSIGIGASYLSKLMHEQLGMSFVDYLTDVRLKKAAFLIENSPRDMMIYELADKVGYSSQHYFSRVFKKYYGISPIQYKEKYYEK